MRAKLSSFTVVTFAGLAMAQSLHAADDLVLAPSSDWSVHPFDDKCRIVRTFGQGEDGVKIWLEKAGPGPYLNMTLMGNPFAVADDKRVTFAFRPSKGVTRSYLSTVSTTGRPVLQLYGIMPVSPTPDDTDRTSDEAALAADPDALLARLEAVDAIAISGGLRSDVTLMTGSMTEPMRELAECMAAIPERRAQAMRAQQSGASRVQTQDASNWAQRIVANYPPDLRSRGVEGWVAVRLQISPEGRASFCEIVANSGIPDFNDAACRDFLRYARFAPALNAEGNPTWGSFETRITYKLN